MTTRWAAGIAFGLYVASLLIPPGYLAFMWGIIILNDCVVQLPATLGKAWLVGISWLANPVGWAAMLMLGIGARRRAVILGEVAVLLSLCAVYVGIRSLCYYLWVGSLAFVVYAGLRGSRSALSEKGASSSDFANPVMWRFFALGIPLLFTMVVVVVSFRFPDAIYAMDNDYDQSKNVSVGEKAKDRILQWMNGRHSRDRVDDGLPTSATGFWIYDGGNFNGSIIYATFHCGSREDCFKAVKFLGAIKARDLKPWKPSRFAVVMKGPDFYSGEKKLNPHPWDVRPIKNGVMYEDAGDGHERMTYWAIDFDRNQVFYHYESGGFPPDEY